MNDAAIIELFWKRSESAITETSEKYGRFCHSISYNILQNEQDVEECLNDTWLGAWNTIPPKRPSAFSIFLGKITRNLSLDKYRKYHAEKRFMTRTAEVLDELEECISCSDNVSDWLEEAYLTECIENFLYAITPEKRNIFIRRYWYLDSIKEISEDYGISESKTALVLFRMRAQLKMILEKEGVK